MTAAMLHGARRATHARAQILRPQAARRSISRLAHTGIGGGGTFRPMNARRLAALGAALITAGCGPTTINVTTTTLGGDAGDTTGDVAETTSLGGTGQVDTSGSTGDPTAGSTESSGSSTGGGSSSSSSSGEPPPVCVLDVSTVTCVCPWGAGNLETDCGCVAIGALCQCDVDGKTYSGPCDPCVFDPSVSICECGGIQADPSMCSCVEGAPGVCLCDGLPAPEEFCGCTFADATDTCSCEPVLTEAGDCYCGDLMVPPEVCG